jgi:hypothetical protein
MPLQATDIDKVQVSHRDHGYSQAAVNEFLATVKTSLARGEAALAQAREHTGAGAEETPHASNPVPIAARLLEFAQTAADEQLAAAAPKPNAS